MFNREGPCSRGCEEVRDVKRDHFLSDEVRRVATAPKVVEEVQEEVQEIKDEWEDEEVARNEGLKVEGEPHTSCVDEMTCATPLSHAMQCVNHDDENLTNKQELRTHVSVFMCAMLKVFWVLVVALSLVSCSVSPRRRNTQYRFLPLRILLFTFVLAVRLYSVIDNSSVAKLLHTFASRKRVI